MKVLPNGKRLNLSCEGGGGVTLAEGPVGTAGTAGPDGQSGLCMLQPGEAGCPVRPTSQAPGSGQRWNGWVRSSSLARDDSGFNS